MKALLVTILLILTSCTNIHGVVTDPKTGASWDVSYNTFGSKKLEDVHGSVTDQGVKFDIGSLSTDTPTGFSNEQLACILLGVCPEKAP